MRVSDGKVGEKMSVGFSLKMIKRFGGFLGVGLLLFMFISMNFDHFWLSLPQGLGLLLVVFVLYRKEK